MTREPKPMIFTDHWRIEEVSFKPWAACRHAHPAIDCALELRALAARNEVYTSLIGLGYHDTITPSVIRRDRKSVV